VHLIVDGSGDHDATGLGEFLQPRRDVDPVAKDVAILDDDVSLVDADPELDPAVGRDGGLRCVIAACISIAQRNASTTLAN